MSKPLSLSIMPTVNGQRKPEFHQISTLTGPDDVGHEVNRAIDVLREHGVEPGSDQLTLEVKVF